jgi:hypothetical protein
MEKRPEYAIARASLAHAASNATVLVRDGARYGLLSSDGLTGSNLGRRPGRSIDFFPETAIEEAYLLCAIELSLRRSES